MPIQGALQGDMQTTAEWTKPTRAAAAWHLMKVLSHILLRALRNTIGGPRRISPSCDLATANLVAEHRSPLWVDGREDEFILRCGKVQNLRLAVRCFDGIEVQAGQRLSFWSQVGRPSAMKGYAVGREIINGCVVPTVGGGLCQLSNALADAALAAGIALVEQHHHSARIEQQLRPAADATVAWNYIDLRLLAGFRFRVEAQLTRDELIVRVRAPISPRLPLAQPRLPLSLVEMARPVARGCLTCDQTRCFRHRPPKRSPAARTAYLLNERSPELQQWLENRQGEADWMMPWLRRGRRHLGWAPPGEARVAVALWAGWKRIARQRLLRGEGSSRQAGLIQAARDLAEHYGRILRPEHTDLVVSQDLLVPLWRSGTLAGRSYEVFVSELPASEIQTRLDAASRANAHLKDLGDFRIDTQWQQDEWQALAGAKKRIIAHREVQRVLEAQGLATELLSWSEPPPRAVFPQSEKTSRILTFAASALARKGAQEVATVARRLGVRVLILGTPPSDAKVWAGVDWCAVGYASDWLEQSDVVVLPAYIEHRPRALLQALAAHIPVVASRACGLGDRPGLIEVEPGDADALEVILKHIFVTRCAPTESIKSTQDRPR